MYWHVGEDRIWDFKRSAGKLEYLSWNMHIFYLLQDDCKILNLFHCFTLRNQPRQKRKKLEPALQNTKAISPEGRLWRGCPRLVDTSQIQSLWSFRAMMGYVWLYHVSHCGHVPMKSPKYSSEVVTICDWQSPCQGAMQISSSTLAQCSKFFRLLGPFLVKGLGAGGHHPQESVQFSMGFLGNLCLYLFITCQFPALTEPSLLQSERLCKAEQNNSDNSAV